MIGGGGRQDVERAHRADLDHHLERLAEQEVADQHARLVAPEHAGGGPAAPHVALVHHVVVQQRRGVHELDRGGELDVAVAGIAGRGCAIASVSIGRSRLPPDEIRWLATSGIIVTSEPVRDRIVGVDPLHVGGHELDQAVDGWRRPDFEWDDDGQVQVSGLTKDAAEHRNAMIGAASASAEM